jgi:hypothetical protein
MEHHLPVLSFFATWFSKYANTPIRAVDISYDIICDGAESAFQASDVIGT